MNYKRIGWGFKKVTKEEEEEELTAKEDLLGSDLPMYICRRLVVFVVVFRSFLHRVQDEEGS